MKRLSADLWQHGSGVVELPVSPKFAFDITVSAWEPVQLVAVRDGVQIPIKTGNDWTFRGVLAGFDKIALVAAGDDGFGFRFHGRERQIEEPHDSDPPPEAAVAMPTDNLLLQMKRSMQAQVSNMRRGAMEPDDFGYQRGYELGDDEEELFEEDLPKVPKASGKAKEAAKAPAQVSGSSEPDEGQGTPLGVVAPPPAS